MKTILKQIFRFFASFGLAVAIFILMFAIILGGTFYQIDHGLYEAQNKYFYSLFVVQGLWLPPGPSSETCRRWQTLPRHWTMAWRPTHII